MIKNFFKDEKAEIIVKEFLIHGSLEMSTVLLKTIAIIFNNNLELKQKRNDLNEIYANFSLLIDLFGQLVKNKFLIKLPSVFNSEENEKNQQDNNNIMNSLLNRKSKIPLFSKTIECETDLPTLNLDGKNLNSNLFTI